MPAVASTYWMHIAIVVLFNITYTVALFSVLRMGYLSLGHAGFIALGAYTCVVLTVRWNFSPWLGIVAAGLVSGAMAWGLGAMIGLAAHRALPMCPDRPFWAIH